MSQVRFESVTKVFDNGVKAIDDVSLEIEPGEFMVLVGPSGCGKSTLLRLVAGLEQVSSGRILMDGDDLTDVAPQDRDLAMVFQSYALYPHMTVRENLGFGLRTRRYPKAEVSTRVDGVAASLALSELLDRRPAQLSGGQRQRVAIGRAMVREPSAFLMDEPLSNLDAKLRVSMRSELARLHERLGATTVYVTHDQIEAMTLGTRVAVLRDGVIQQVGPPDAVFDAPANLFVAAFIGSPPMNLAEASVDARLLRFADVEVPVPADLELRDGQRVIVGIRPEDLAVSGPGADAARLEITVEVAERLGSETVVTFAVSSPPVQTDAVEAAHDTKDVAPLVDDAQRARFTARVPGRSTIAPGDSLSLTVDAPRLHLFDPRTGHSLRLADS